MITLNEEIDQVIKLLDDVVDSYPRGNPRPAGLQEGAATAFYSSERDGQGKVNARFIGLDTRLKSATEAIRASVADHRAADDQADERLRVHLNELAMAEDGTAREGTLQAVKRGKQAPAAGSTGLPDGSQ